MHISVAYVGVGILAGDMYKMLMVSLSKVVVESVCTAFCVKMDCAAVYFYISGGIYQYLIFERN